MTSTVTTDFREEYEAARETLLRRRFLWYAGVVMGLGGLQLIVQLVAFFIFAQGRDFAVQFTLQFILGGITTAIYFAAFMRVWRRKLNRPGMLRLLFRLIVAAGAIAIIGNALIFESSRDEVRRQMELAQQSDTVTTQVAPGFKLMTKPQPGEAENEGSADEQGEESNTQEQQGATPPPEPITEHEVSKNIARQAVLGNALGSVFLTHFFACLFIPWTVRESLKPIVPLVLLNAVVTLFYIRLVPTGGTIVILGSPLVALPGAMICMWRTGRFRRRFHFKMLKGRYGEMKQDLGVARQIHDAMFPEPLLTGPVRFEYCYEPMRQIGGDYLFARVIEGETGDLPVLNLAIVDVTGHGIGAALTVNRLHGEIERLLGESPEATPGELLTGLNNYLHHTLASHSVYATAIFMRIDTNANNLIWASAGHPPAFLRAIDGTLDRLDSTTLVLGACKGDDFHPNDQSARFGAGDVLIAYTDGATESRNDKGRMLGVDGLQSMIANGHPDEDGGWAASVLREVDAHRYGPAQDDTLIVEIYRPLNLTGEAYIPPTR